MQLGPGSKAPAEIDVLIEISQGSSVKYELDKELGLLRVDRFLHTAMYYPFNYGHIPGTLAEDGDPLDVMVLSVGSALPGSVITVVPIGVLEMEDEAGRDEKIIAVPKTKLDPFTGIYADISQLPESYRNQIKHFYDHMKELEPGKWVKTGEFSGAEAARASISAAIERAKK